MDEFADQLGGLDDVVLGTAQPVSAPRSLSANRFSR